MPIRSSARTSLETNNFWCFASLLVFMLLENPPYFPAFKKPQLCGSSQKMDQGSLGSPIAPAVSMRRHPEKWEDFRKSLLGNLLVSFFLDTLCLGWGDFV